MAKIQEMLLSKVASLEAELAVYKNRKNSGNSHKPPSTDMVAPKRNQSLREKTDKKSGGQPGHKGHTLQMNDHPDKVVEHKPCTCGNCGSDLSGVGEEVIEKRQVVDIPPVKPQWVEHRLYAKTCSCGHITEGHFPQGVAAPVQYGSNTEALAVYLHSRQYLSFERSKEFFNYAMGLPISEGCLVNMVQRFALKAQPAYEAIKANIEQAGCLGADETGGKVNGEKQWFWAWQNEQLTFIVHSPSRGFDTIEKTFPDGFPNTILVHDRWAAQLKCEAKGHQVCSAHLLRDLNFIDQLYDSQWARDFKAVIKDAITLKSQMADSDYDLFGPPRTGLERRLQHILEQPVPDTHHKAATFRKKISKISQQVLLFLHYPAVPADNNGSERAIRNVKVKQKISGQFKSDDGAVAFAIIRSIIDTAIKAGKNVLNELAMIANLNPASD
jgi:transposase